MSTHRTKYTATTWFLYTLNPQKHQRPNFTSCGANKPWLWMIVWCKKRIGVVIEKKNAYWWWLCFFFFLGGGCLDECCMRPHMGPFVFVSLLPLSRIRLKYSWLQGLIVSAFYYFLCCHIWYWNFQLNNINQGVSTTYQDLITHFKVISRWKQLKTKKTKKKNLRI